MDQFKKYFPRVILFLLVFYATTELTGYLWCRVSKGAWSFTELACRYPEPVVATPTPEVTPEPTPIVTEHPLIRLDAPVAGTVISSPLTLTGEARGPWYFEASFPVELLDADQNVLATGVATAIGDWMTEDFVPFSTTLTFVAPIVNNQGALVLKKDNPSGEPANDDSIQVPVLFF